MIAVAMDKSLTLRFNLAVSSKGLQVIGQHGAGSLFVLKVDVDDDYYPINEAKTVKVTLPKGWEPKDLSNIFVGWTETDCSNKANCATPHAPRDINDRAYGHPICSKASGTSIAPCGGASMALPPAPPTSLAFAPSPH
ncbi:MAG: hypothetical protein KC933_18205 [Myxococcales bacterium]|nr:hypothetical protein [Myxococcales bacterium]MCB9650872.1 hypothetical protein [Deltaproteobacteria bacterium]